MHVVLDWIVMHFVKAHDFNHLFKCTFLCDDDVCDRLATLESTHFSDVMSRARLTIFMEFLLHPRTDLLSFSKPYATINHKG